MSSSTYSFIKIGGQSNRFRKIQRFLIRRKHQNVGNIKSSSLGRTHKVHEQFRLSKVAHHDNNGIPKGNLFHNGSQIFQNIVNRVQIPPQHVPLLVRILDGRRTVLVPTIRLVSTRYILQRPRLVETTETINAHPFLQMVRFVLRYNGNALLSTKGMMRQQDIDVIAILRGIRHGKIGNYVGTASIDNSFGETLLVAVYHEHAGRSINDFIERHAQIQC
jgi:hypothetical protein